MSNGDAGGRVTMTSSFKGAHFPQEIILMGVRWYLAYPLSSRHVEELMEERGVLLDHATLQRWVVQYSPQREEAFHRRKRPVWVSWRMDETSIKIKGQWYSLPRRRQDGPDHRLPPHGAPGRAGVQAISDQGDPPPWRAREEHHRRECG